MFHNSSPSFRFPWPAALLLCVFALGVSGCGRYTRTKQCRALIAQVNPALDDVATITGSGGAGGAAGRAAGGGTGGSAGMSGNAGFAGGSGAAFAGQPTSAAYLAAAGRYERLAKQLGPMEFASEDIAKTVAEYAAVLQASAQALRSLAAGLDANNYGETERANRELERLSSREHAAISHIDAWCAPGT